MPKGSPELTAARREEIIDACEGLYRELPFKDITIGMIAGRTTFTRASIYNYFKTKEEIFLALLQREYEPAVRGRDVLHPGLPGQRAEQLLTRNGKIENRHPGGCNITSVTAHLLVG